MNWSEVVEGDEVHELCCVVSSALSSMMIPGVSEMPTQNRGTKKILNKIDGDWRHIASQSPLKIMIS
jgi:hypothetical protein